MISGHLPRCADGSPRHAAVLVVLLAVGFALRSRLGFDFAKPAVLHCLDDVRAATKF